MNNVNAINYNPMMHHTAQQAHNPQYNGNWNGQAFMGNNQNTNINQLITILVQLINQLSGGYTNQTQPQDADMQQAANQMIMNNALMLGNMQYNMMNEHMSKSPFAFGKKL